MIEENVKKLFAQIPESNPFGEKVTLVAAVKTQTPQDINRAIRAGICAVGDNHVQEFREKYDLIEGPVRHHFIGHLQTNKVKYLLGKIDLYHSLDRYELADELSRRGERAGVVSPVLLQINIGREKTKSGFNPDETTDAYAAIKDMTGIKIKGLMAMLPETDDEKELARLATLMREKYDLIKKDDSEIEYLSMGMSGDWKICVECGSNMIRLGTAIFGARKYT